MVLMISRDAAAKIVSKILRRGTSEMSYHAGICARFGL